MCSVHCTVCLCFLFKTKRTSNRTGPLAGCRSSVRQMRFGCYSDRSRYFLDISEYTSYFLARTANDEFSHSDSLQALAALGDRNVQCAPACVLASVPVGSSLFQRRARPALALPASTILRTAHLYTRMAAAAATAKRSKLS